MHQSNTAQSKSNYIKEINNVLASLNTQIQFASKVKNKLSPLVGKTKDKAMLSSVDKLITTLENALRIRDNTNVTLNKMAKMKEEDDFNFVNQAMNISLEIVDITSSISTDAINADREIDRVTKELNQKGKKNVK